MPASGERAFETKPLILVMKVKVGAVKADTPPNTRLVVAEVSRASAF
jgi:hypothetical protein